MRTRFAANNLKVIKALAAFLVLLVLVIAGSEAFAHESRDVGKYHFVAGFVEEPVLEGQKNGVDLTVTSNTTGKPVEGLDKTIQVEITHVSSGAAKTFKLRAVFRDPGHYTSDLIFTAPGQYRLRFFGDIEGTPVNETFTPDEEVESSDELQFPQTLPQVRELTAATKGAEKAADEAQSMALSTRATAIAGIVLGVLGIASGVGFGMAARRKH